MKIGYDAKRAFTNTSGLGNYSRDVIRAMKDFQKDDIFLFTPKENKKLFNISGTQIIKPNRKVDKWIKSYWRTFSISDEINRLGLDVFHGLSNELPFGLNRHTKTVITIHDLIFKRFPEWYNYFDRKIYDQKVKFGVERADKIIAISEQTKRDIIHYYNIPSGKIEVVYQTCNEAFKSKAKKKLTERVKEKYNLSSDFLLYVGTIEPRKNALKIVKALHSYNIDIPLIIIGKATEYSKQIKEYINNNGLNLRVKMLHQVTQEELPVFYQQAKVFIYPSLFEGFGIPIIEALYSGTPVITSKGGCFPEAGGPSTVYIDPENHDELANALIDLLNDKQKRKKMAESGKEYVKKFDSEVVTKNLHQLYERLVSNN